MRLVLALVAGAMLSGEAPAQQPMAGMDNAVATCPPTPAPLLPELAGWARMTPIKAGPTVARAATLTVGTGASASLLLTPKITYPLRPEKPGGLASHCGLFAFTVGEAGRYRVALGSGAWIDVISNGTAATSVAHGHGPDCSTIRKMVDFDLAPGRYLLQVAGNGAPTLPLMVARLP